MARHAEWLILPRRNWKDSPAFLPAVYVAAFALCYAVPFGSCFDWTVAAAVTAWVARWRMKRRLEPLRDLPAAIDQVAVTL